MATGLPGSPEQPPPPLLRLSPLIRRRIYRYVGLASWDGCSYRFDLHGRAASCDAPEPRSFHGLLLCCRAIYAEAAALLYSSNRFILHYSHTNPASLEPLRALRPSTLAALASLSVVLNQASCHHPTNYDACYLCCVAGHEDDDLDGSRYCEKNHGGLHHLPLLSPASEHETSSAPGDDGDDNLGVAQRLQREWHSAAGCLSYTTSGRLELSLVCDIDPRHDQALSIARSAVAPLRLLPQSHLKACHIRLGKTADFGLQQVARETVIHACGITTPASRPSLSTTLVTLPRELRLRILEYTDLITPIREVTWSRQDGGYVVTTTRPNSDSPSNLRHSAQFFQCWLGNNMGCFCRRRHAAFSLRCECWLPPGPLFLVCRTLYRDSQLVFFSGNRFIVHDFRSHAPWRLPFLDDAVRAGEDTPSYSYPFERLAISHFLREVAVSSLAHLRFLEVVFPPYLPASWPQAEHSAMQDWWATVGWLRDKINAPGLTLRIVVAETSMSTPDCYRPMITFEEGKLIMRACEDLLHPLTQLVDCGLARFYSDLVYPWELADETEVYGLASWDVVRDRRKKLNESAERRVMGDRYESLYADNKEEPEPSLWWYWYYSF